MASALEEREMSDQEAADLFGCSRTAMQRYKTGERAPSGKVLFAIEKIFKIPAESWFK